MSSNLENSYLREGYHRIAFEMDADILMGARGMQQGYPEPSLLGWRRHGGWRRVWKQLRCVWRGHAWKVKRVETGPRPRTEVRCVWCDTEAARFNDPRVLA